MGDTGSRLAYSRLGTIIKPLFAGSLRSRRALAGSGAMLIGRIMGMAVNFLMIGILARHFSREEFGLYAVLTSFMAISGSLDFGVSNGLRNKLAGWAKNASKEYYTPQQYFMATLYILFALMVFTGALLALFSSSLPWTRIFRITDGALGAQASVWFVVIASLILLIIPFGLYAAGFFAYQKSFWNAFFDVLSKLGALILVVLAIAFHAPFFVVTSAFFGAFTVSALVGLVVFIRDRRWHLVRLHWITLATCVRNLTGLSLQFWLLAVLSAIGMYSSTYITGQVLGLEAAGDFSLVQRLFYLLIGFHLSFITPFWSAFTEAQASGDWVWARSTMRRLAWLSAGAMMLGCTVMIVFYKQFLWVWTGKQIDNTGLVVMTAAWTVMYAWSSVFSVVLNGFGLLRLQLALGIFVTLILLPLSVYLGHQMGAVGIMLAFVIIAVPGSLIYPFLCESIIKRKLEKVEPIPVKSSMKGSI